MCFLQPVLPLPLPPLPLWGRFASQISPLPSQCRCWAEAGDGRLALAQHRTGLLRNVQEMGPRACPLREGTDREGSSESPPASSAMASLGVFWSFPEKGGGRAVLLEDNDSSESSSATMAVGLVARRLYSIGIGSTSPLTPYAELGINWNFLG